MIPIHQRLLIHEINVNTDTSFGLGCKSMQRGWTEPTEKVCRAASELDAKDGIKEGV